MTFSSFQRNGQSKGFGFLTPRKCYPNPKPLTITVTNDFDDDTLFYNFRNTGWETSWRWKIGSFGSKKQAEIDDGGQASNPFKD